MRIIDLDTLDLPGKTMIMKVLDKYEKEHHMDTIKFPVSKCGWMLRKYVRCIVINLKPEQLTEWNGFDVYDAETGENLLPSQVAEKSFPEDRFLSIIAHGFCLTWEGHLYLTEDGSRGTRIPKEGKYLIQINGEKYMRW